MDIQVGQTATCDGTDDRQSWSMEQAQKDYHEAMERGWALPEAFKRSLDDAVKTGVCLSAERIMVQLDADYEGPLAPITSDWNGRNHEGRPIDAVESLPWCTVRHHYGWGIPCAESLEVVSSLACQHKGLIEVGAGSGYWTAVLKARTGLDIQAFDTGQWRGDDWSFPWCKIDRGDAVGAVQANPHLPVLMVWADPAGIGGRVAKAMAPDQVLIHAGPMQHTGDRAYHACLEWEFDVIDVSIDVGAGGGSYPLYVLQKRTERRKKKLGIFVKKQLIPRLPGAPAN